MSLIRAAVWALAAMLGSTEWPGGRASDAVHVVLDTSESDAVLRLLEQLRAGGPGEQVDWDALFATPGYRRLAAREAAMKRPLTRQVFQAFVGSADVVGRAEQLAATVSRWKKVDVAAAAKRAFAYLPARARIDATIFLVIKPQPNSFVFHDPAPAIFFAVDPSVTPDQLANKMTHELHHIGVDSACPPAAVQAVTKTLSQSRHDAQNWLSAFGEGFAMLAAAGRSDIHPHAVSRPEDRARWDRDMQNVDRDLESLDQFFRDVLEGRLTSQQAEDRGSTFFGVQGPWYTVGYRMAASIERAFGRDDMIRCFCDVRRLPAAYNRAADKLRLRGARWSLPMLTEIQESGETPVRSPTPEAPLAR